MHLEWTCVPHFPILWVIHILCRNLVKLLLTYPCGCTGLHWKPPVVTIAKWLSSVNESYAGRTSTRCDGKDTFTMFLCHWQSGNTMLLDDLMMCCGFILGWQNMCHCRLRKFPLTLLTHNNNAFLCACVKWWEDWFQKVTLKMSHIVNGGPGLAKSVVSVCHSFLSRWMVRHSEPMGGQRWGCNRDPGKNSPLFPGTLQKCDLPPEGFCRSATEGAVTPLTGNTLVRQQS